jgi:hypothetical protein
MVFSGLSVAVVAAPVVGNSPVSVADARPGEPVDVEKDYCSGPGLRIVNGACKPFIKLKRIHWGW